MPNTAPATVPKPMGAAKVMPIRPQTISINPGKVMQQVKPEVSADQAEENREADKPFTLDECKAALQKYIDSLGPAKKHNLLVIWTNNPHQINGHVIHVTATSKIQANLLEQEKGDMLDMIRDCLKNRQVSLEVTIELPPEAPVQKMFSNNERFEMMAAKNPILHELKTVFELDTETPH